MKRISLLTLAVLLWASPALACERVTRLYATATTVDFCLYVTDATVGAIKLETATCVNGGGAGDSDVYLMKDEGADTDGTNCFVDEGACYSLALSSGEMTAARIVVNIEDQGTKTWADQCVIIETYGHASAQHGIPTVDVLSISGDTTAADNAELMFDGTGYAGGTTRINVNTDTITANAITASAIAADAIGASELAASAIGASELATDAFTSDELATSFLAEYFTTNSGSTYASAVAGSVIKETVDNVSGGGGGSCAVRRE